MNKLFLIRGNIKTAIFVVLGVVVIAVAVSTTIFFGGQLLHKFFLGYGWTVYEDVANNFQISYPPDWKVDSRQGGEKKLFVVLNPEGRVAVSLGIISTGSSVTPEFIYENLIKPHRQDVTSVEQTSFNRKFAWEVIYKPNNIDIKQLIVGFGTKVFIISYALNPEQYGEIIMEVVDSLEFIK